MSVIKSCSPIKIDTGVKLFGSNAAGVFAIMTIIALSSISINMLLDNKLLELHSAILATSVTGGIGLCLLENNRRNKQTIQFKVSFLSYFKRISSDIAPPLRITFLVQFEKNHGLFFRH